VNNYLKVNESLLLFEAICYKRHSQGITYFWVFLSNKRNFPIRISSGFADRWTFHFERTIFIW